MTKKIKDVNTTSTSTSNVSQMDQFRTAKYHSEPQKMPLFTSDGAATEHYLMVLGVQSHVIRKKKQELIREAAKSIKEGEWNEETQQKFSNELLSHAVTGWSFDEEVTVESVKQFLLDAPDISDAIDVFCNQNENYFLKK